MQLKTGFTFLNNIKEDEKLRASFNELTRKTFGFDFEEWYQKGHWQEKYIPHVIVDKDKVVSNVSVNLMQFMTEEGMRTYIQLGTVMTDPEYRGQGLNRYIMEWIIEEYRDKVDGIYLFGNDSVLGYYPKFGFKQGKEYVYTYELQDSNGKEAYTSVQTDMSDKKACNKFYEAIGKDDRPEKLSNANDDFYMCNNLGLYQFWLAADYGDSVYYMPEIDGYVVADMEGTTLVLQQIFAAKEVEMERLAKAFGADITNIRLGYTPVNRVNYKVDEYKEEDCTLFVIGEQLETELQKKIFFPVMSHA